MSMKIDVWSRSRMSRIAPDPNLCIISVQSQIALGQSMYEEFPINLEGWKAAHLIQFDDVTHTNGRDVVHILGVGSKPTSEFTTVPFNEEMAANLIDFIEANKDSNMVVHCDAGISRSAAIASFMHDFYDYEPTYHQTGDDQYRNIHVYNLLRREAMERISGLD